jgi:hypothetical protein
VSLSLIIERTDRVVEQVNVGVTICHSRQPDPLLLTSGQTDSFLCDRSLVTFEHILEILLKCARVDNSSVASFVPWFTADDVLLNAALLKPCNLRGVTNFTADSNFGSREYATVSCKWRR